MHIGSNKKLDKIQIDRLLNGYPDTEAAPGRRHWGGTNHFQWGTNIFWVQITRQ